MRDLNLNKNNKNIKMLINKNTFEIDPQFIYDDDILGTSLDNYPDYYIFTDGSVYSNKTNRFMKPMIRGKYLQIALYKDGIRKMLTLSRLVAIAFIPNPDPPAAIAFNSNITLAMTG